MQAGMELAVRAQVKISFYFEVSETVLCFWDISGLNPFPCFFERHETCDREQSERHRAQLRRHIHGQLLCVRPARSFTWGNNPGQTRQNHCLCELERSDIIVTLFQHKFLSSNALFEGKCLLFCFSQAVDTQTEKNQTTSTFMVENITVSAAGRWLCQVKVKHFQEEKEFMVIVKGEILQLSPFPSQQSSKNS